MIKLKSQKKQKEEKRKVKGFSNKIKEILNKIERPVMLVSEEGLIIYVNKEFLSLKGVDEDEVIGKRIEDIIVDKKEEKKLYLFKFIPDLIFAARKDGTITDYFKNEDKLLLFPKEFLGKKIQNILPNGFKALKLIEDVIDKEKVVKYEYSNTLPYPNSEVRFFEAHIVKSNNEEVVCLIKDITEKKKWERRLKESEERFQAIAEITPSAIFIHDGERYLYVNPPMEHITGYSKEELLSMKLWEIIHPDYREMVKDFARRRVLGEDVPSKYETKILTKDGRERWANIYAKKVSYNEKSIVLGLAFDITDLKRAEEALRESEEKFRVIFENAGVGITLVDREGRLIDCNSHFRNFVGYTKEELIGKHWRIYTHPEDVERNLDIFEKMIEEKKVFVFEKRFKRKDGRILWGRVTISPVFDSNGRFLFQIGITEDITKEKKAIEALKKSESKYRSLVEKMSEGIYILYNNRFEFVNNRFIEMFGYTREELRRVDFRKLIAPESLPLIEERARKLKRGEPVPEKYEFVALDKHGRKVYVEVSVTYVPYKEGIATQGIVRDITEKKAYEKKLRYMATHDILTGLPNRSYFMEFLKAAIESSKRYGHMVCIMMLDLDGFKEVNDKFGHDVGDRALVRAAERLRRSVRRSDILSRMGGDEFLVLVPILKRVEDAETIGRKIVNSFREPLRVNGELYYITVSVGASIFPQDGTDAIELIKKADMAMYKVKGSGKDGFLLYSNFIKES